MTGPFTRSFDHGDGVTLDQAQAVDSFYGEHVC